MLFGGFVQAKENYGGFMAVGTCWLAVLLCQLGMLVVWWQFVLVVAPPSGLAETLCDLRSLSRTSSLAKIFVVISRNKFVGQNDTRTSGIPRWLNIFFLFSCGFFFFCFISFVSQSLSFSVMFSLDLFLPLQIDSSCEAKQKK